MDLLISLGVNSSLAYQLAIFVVCYLVLKYLLFTPYFKAYNERNLRTVGQTELAEQYISETRQLEERFAQRATEINEKYKDVFDKTRAEANRSYDQVVFDARAKAKQLLDDSRKQIGDEMAKVQDQLKSEVGSISQLINQKLVGKDLGT